MSVVRLLKCFGAAATLAIALPDAGTAQSWVATLNGASEAPPNASPGTGSATFALTGTMFTINVSFSGLMGLVTAAHIHCCLPTPFTGTVGVATQIPSFVGFPSGVTGGSYLHTFDISLASFYRAGFITSSGGLAAAQALFVSNLGTGREYFNIHTTIFPGGEIRGFVVPDPTVVPEPVSLALVGTGLLGVGLVAFRRRRS